MYFRSLMVLGLCGFLAGVACVWRPRQVVNTVSSETCQKEAALGKATLSQAIRFTYDGRTEAVLRQDGRLFQGTRGARVFGSLRPDWAFVSPAGVLYARLHRDGRLELAHGNPQALTIERDGTAILPNGQRITVSADSTLGGLAPEEAVLRFEGITTGDRRAVMFVFFAWSLTIARLDETKAAVREIRRTVDLVMARQGGRCPRSLQEMINQGHLSRARGHTDSWGSNYQLRCTSNSAPLVFSLGPDRRLGTGDDIRSDR